MCELQPKLIQLLEVVWRKLESVLNERIGGLPELVESKPTIAWARFYINDYKEDWHILI